MSGPNEKLAEALGQLRELQADGSRVFASHQLTRAARERLLKHGFLQEVMKGWLISISPESRPGDTTPWFASFWEFCAQYCTSRFEDSWYLSPEQSLLLHAESTTVPVQVIVQSPDANNNRVDLLFETSLFALKARPQDPDDLEVIGKGLRVFTVPAALIRVPPGFFADRPVEAQLAVESIRDPSPLLRRLLAGGHSVVAGRLAGAFRRLERGAIADEIVSAMKSADHQVRENDPFEPEQVLVTTRRARPAVVGRLQALWAGSRETVIEELTAEPGRPRDPTTYLSRVDDVYKLDAYHSLSIEGYQVTPALIERVASGVWNPDDETQDRADRNALAAHGYWRAFQLVRAAVRNVIRGKAGPVVVYDSHRDWYRELFAPQVAAGLVPAVALAGYRTAPVYLRGSRHVPPRSEVVGEAMEALFDLIEAEPEASVRAVLGHWLIGYVHPFPDGNGRIARFAMNVLLAGGGYSWTVIRVDDRDDYLNALEVASVDGDVRPFARFIARQMKLAKPATRPRARRRRR